LTQIKNKYQKREISENQGVKIKTLYYYSTPSYKKRGTGDKGNRRVLVKIEEDDDV
jgi:hypothetical protein